jgi:hypothetical protein
MSINGIRFMAACLACLAVECHSQGTMTLTFEGRPPGSVSQVGTYSEAGISFVPIPIGSLYLSGGGVTGYPDNGTGYLYAPDNGMWVSTATPFPQPFNLISFDAARYAAAAPPTLMVVGQRLMASPVTNYFTLTSGGSDFQTCNLDSSFVNLLRVDIYARFSLDNLVISGVPEPSGSALILLGAVFGLGWRCGRKKPLDR